MEGMNRIALETMLWMFTKKCRRMTKRLRELSQKTMSGAKAQLLEHLMRAKNLRSNHGVIIMPSRYSERPSVEPTRNNRATAGNEAFVPRTRSMD